MIGPESDVTGNSLSLIVVSARLTICGLRGLGGVPIRVHEVKVIEGPSPACMYMYNKVHNHTNG